MKLIDTRATKLAASSLFLTRAEFRDLYPHRLNSRIDYLFKGGVPKDVPEAEAKILMEKYDHILKWEEKLNIVQTNRHQELDKKGYNELKKYAGTLEIPFKKMRVKKMLLIDHIVAKEIQIHTIKEKAKANRRDGVKEGNKDNK